MNNQSIQTMQNILGALMTISVKGEDVITMSNVLQAMQSVINDETKAAQDAAKPKETVEPEIVG